MENNSVIQFLLYTFMGRLVLVLVAFFDVLFVGLVMARRTTKHIVADLGLARHVLVTWLIVPIFWLYFLWLKRLGKIQLVVNNPIPWEEVKLIFAANHQMPKLQDTFLLAVTIFFLRPKNYLNPIRYFPKSTADENNFVKSRFFKILGNGSLISVSRKSKNGTGNGELPPIEAAKKHFEEDGTIETFYVERGRTQTAVRKGRAKKWLTSGGEELALGRLGIGAAKLALETNTSIIPVWGRITNDNSYPAASPLMVLRGLAELFFSPKTRVYIDINHPFGALRPMVGRETPRELTKRLEVALFEIGEIQSNRLRSKKK